MMTEPSLTYTKPLFEVDGAVKAELFDDIQRLEIEETTAGLKTLSLRLVAQGATADSPEQGQLYLDGSVIDFGRKIQSSSGLPRRRTPSSPAGSVPYRPSLRKLGNPKS